MSAVRRIGVLTGGGDAPGLNAVIRAVVRSCKVAHGVSVTGILDGFIGLVEMKVRELSLADVSGLLVRGGTVLGTSNRGNPFRYAFRRPDGVEELVDASATAKKNFGKLGLDGLIVIGGDGSLSIAERFWRELGSRSWVCPRRSTTTSSGPSTRSGSPPPSIRQAGRSTDCTAPPKAITASCCSK